MKKKRIIILVLNLLAVAAAAFFFIKYTNEEVQPTDVYVFAHDMKANDEITAADIRSIEVPSAAVRKGFELDKKEIVGKYVGNDVHDGAFIYKADLIEEGEQDPFESMELERYRKISLPITFESGFGGNIERGDKIDLVYNSTGTKVDEENMGAEEPFVYAKTFLQDIIVYSVTTQTGTPYVDRTETGFGEEEEVSSEEMAVITLAVTLDQAEEISARMNAGTIQFVGRFNDNESYETNGFVLGEYEKQFVAPADVETNRPKGE